MNLTQRRANRQEESEMEECLTQKLLFEEWLPIIQRLGRPGQASGIEMVNKLAQLGVFVLAELAVTGKSEKVRASCGKELAHMGGLKPVDRSASIDVHLMAEAEIDALLLSKIEETGLDKMLMGIAQGGINAIRSGAARSIEVVASRPEETVSCGGNGEGKDAEGVKVGELQTAQRNVERAT